MVRPVEAFDSNTRYPDAVQIVDSPNHDRRPSQGTIDTLVLHYTGMKDFESALARLTDPVARVSAHYLIDEVGEVFQLVSEERRAWHAGVASWCGTEDINGCSIGIELVNPGHEFGYRPFPQAQIAALHLLAKDVLVRQRIPSHRVLGHSDIAPTRRCDPGELFDWEGAAAAGIGVWPVAFDLPSQSKDASLELGCEGEDVREVQQSLARFGYGIEPTGVFDEMMRDVVTAFQRHFRQARVDGILDFETQGRLAVLLEHCG